VGWSQTFASSGHFEVTLRCVPAPLSQNASVTDYRTQARWTGIRLLMEEHRDVIRIGGAELNATLFLYDLSLIHSKLPGRIPAIPRAKRPPHPCRKAAFGSCEPSKRSSIPVGRNASLGACLPF
jgi:hypothetical protein